ncbi:MAG: hypothetical protein MUE73_14480 [Planctomycetes bacterium]|jgi:hypothetical protein|nr:hypothetical protein [Planctomycetota bacterium]
MLRRLLPIAALVLLLAATAAAEPTAPDRPVQAIRIRAFWLGVIIPFAILFVLCVLSSLAPWKRVRRRRRMPAVIRPPTTAGAEVARGGWRHARALGKYHRGVEMPRVQRPWRIGGI